MSTRNCGCGGAECGGIRRESRSAGDGVDAQTEGQNSAAPLGKSGSGDTGPRDMDRREFVAAAAVGGAALATSLGRIPFVAGPFSRQEGVDHFVPADKRLNPQWVRALFERGEPTWYSGEDLRTIGMPIGGICAGQLYLSGDGRLACWDIFNRNESTGAGAANYEVGRTPDLTVERGQIAPSLSVEQGFAVRIRAGGREIRRTLDSQGFADVSFCGEYPLGRVRFRDDALPIQAELLAFSPFIPLNAEDSALPATVLRYALRNTSEDVVEVELAGWLENVVCHYNGSLFGDRVVRWNQAVDTDLFAAVSLWAEEAAEVPTEPERDPIVLATFDGDDYGDWTVEGEAFGTAPATGTLENQNPVSGFDGSGLVNTFLGGDGPHGRLTSPPFTIQRAWISFLVGGGGHEDRTCMNLVVDGATVRTATGVNRERLEPHNWNVEDLQGREARLVIVDEESGGWGHINIDQIELRDSPRTLDPGTLEEWPDYGSLCLGVLGEGWTVPSLPAGSPEEEVFRGGDRARSVQAGREAGEGPGSAPNRIGGSFPDRMVGGVGAGLTLDPGEEGEITFLLTWHMPNMYREDVRVGNRYGVRFHGAQEVADYLARNLDSLEAQTRAWHDTYYDSTLPRWLLDRVHSTVSNLATNTCQWWENGRFWAWEGAGCCRGTCGHVWNYEHAMARLFPVLERSVREMQDFAPGVGFYPETGAIGFRGEGWTLWAGDSQGGYVLKALREHQTAPDDAFLRRNWPNIRKATEFLIQQDGDGDGLLEGQQHQTYDENYFGANTMVGSLYLGALRAAEEMALEMGDQAFARTCREIFQAGQERSVERLFNGEYFVQDVNLEEHPDWQYGDGCLADQLFGQGWAHQVSLGYLYPPEAVHAALSSIYKYCWAPDIGPQNQAHRPERWFALPGEAGLFTCTWPRSPHMGPRSTRYRNEVWTGIEYQVAGHMAWEGLLTEALAICRGIHERYHPSKHNPYNEIECGDHYARALASWTMITSLSGFTYHGPRGLLGFAPRLNPEAFRSPFTAARGWGTLAQIREGSEQENSVSVVWGTLPVSALALEVPAGAQVRGWEVVVGDASIPASMSQEDQRVRISLPEDREVPAGETLRARLRW